MPINKFSSISLPLLSSLVILVVMVAIGASFLLKTNSSEESPYTEEVAGENSVLDRDFLVIVSDIENLRVDREALGNVFFTRLQDLRAPLREESIGKTNLFLPN